jgi:quercetin dioxygenase-like cupin family protein
MKKALVIDPETWGRKFMMGTAKEKTLREIKWLIDEELVNSEQYVGGLATFLPGNAAPSHSHPDAEEINVALEGEGKLRTPNGEQLIKKGDWQFIPKGLEHCHVNSGNKPFTILWLYSPPSKSFPKS